MTQCTQGTISDFTTVLGLLNGMIGGTILVLPILGLQAGYINMFVLSIVMGFVIFYTTYLVVIHIGKSKNIKECILTHFNQQYKYVKIYSFVQWFSAFTLFFIYFRLIVLQVEALFGNYSQIAPLCAAILFILVCFARIYGVGQQTLAVGIISIFLYLVFIGWAIISEPKGENQIATFGQVYPLISTFTFAYGVSPLVAQNIYKNPNKSNYKKIIVYVYVGAILTYTFITCGGSYSILNRISNKAKPETIQDYYKQGNWQVIALQLIYLVHLITVFPNYLIVSKIRFYDFFKVELKPQPSWHQILYIFITIFASLLIFTIGVNLQTLIQIKGCTFGYANAFLFPILIHLKCTFFDRSSGEIEGKDSFIEEIKPNSCECDNKYSSKWTLYLETVFLILLIILGFVNMIGSIAGMIK